MWELLCDVECPHCGHENDHTTVAFNMDESDQCGCNSHLMEQVCFECDKSFFFDAYVSFDVDVNNIWKKKPPKKRK